MGEEGIPILIENQELDIFSWFAFAGDLKVVIIDHTMTVFELSSEIENESINLKLQEALDNCTPCGESGNSGDVNNDGMVNVVDVILTVNLALSGEYHEQADINQDNTVNVMDVVLIVNMILGN